MYDSLLHLFNSVIPVSDALRARLISLLRVETFPKKTILLREGQICNHIYFIEKGFVRSFCRKESQEITSWFMKEGDVFISVNSFFNRQPTREYIETIEESTLCYIHYDELQEIYKDFIEFNIIGRVLTEKYYVLCEERLYSIRKQRSEERYQFLLSYHPQILQRAPLKYVASYLGISLETLSRIRAKKNKPKKLR
jgi:CRP-like cAMP-binding protein